MKRNSKSPPRDKNNRNPQQMGISFPFGIDQNTLSEEEINNLLQITSEKSLLAIARETEKLAGENHAGSNMVRGDTKITLTEIEEFMREISVFKANKVTKKELRAYLDAFPQPNVPEAPQGKNAPPKEDPEKARKNEVNFLMNGKNELEAGELYDLLKNTQIEDFDAVEEAFKLLDVNSTGYLTVDTFKNIFEKLKLGTIAASDVEIFKEVADFDGDGLISLEDFRKILTYTPGDADELIPTKK